MPILEDDSEELITGKTSAEMATVCWVTHACKLNIVISEERIIELTFKETKELGGNRTGSKRGLWRWRKWRIWWWFGKWKYIYNIL